MLHSRQLAHIARDRLQDVQKTFGCLRSLRIPRVNSIVRIASATSLLRSYRTLTETRLPELRNVCAKLLKLNRPSRAVRVSASNGVSSSADVDAPRELMKAVEDAMYASKKVFGRNRVTSWPIEPAATGKVRAARDEAKGRYRFPIRNRLGRMFAEKPYGFSAISWERTVRLRGPLQVSAPSR
jgi:hypothetical protein